MRHLVLDLTLDLDPVGHEPEYLSDEDLGDAVVRKLEGDFLEVFPSTSTGRYVIDAVEVRG